MTEVAQALFSHGSAASHTDPNYGTSPGGT
jgi:hypothetical protein